MLCILSSRCTLLFWYFTEFYHPILLCILLTTSSYLFSLYSLALPICPLVNTNGIPYVCAAFCDSVYLCDGPDDEHLIGWNMLSIWHFCGNKRILLCWRIIFHILRSTHFRTCVAITLLLRVHVKDSPFKFFPDISDARCTIIQLSVCVHSLH